MCLKYVPAQMSKRTKIRHHYLNFEPLFPFCLFSRANSIISITKLCERWTWEEISWRYLCLQIFVLFSVAVIIGASSIFPGHSLLLPNLPPANGCKSTETLQVGSTPTQGRLKVLGSQHASNTTLNKWEMEIGRERVQLPQPSGRTSLQYIVTITQRSPMRLNSKTHSWSQLIYDPVVSLPFLSSPSLCSLEPSSKSIYSQFLTVLPGIIFQVSYLHSHYLLSVYSEEATLRLSLSACCRLQRGWGAIDNFGDKIPSWDLNSVWYTALPQTRKK